MLRQEGQPGVKILYHFFHLDCKVKRVVNAVNGSSAAAGRGTAPGGGRVPTSQKHQGLPRPSSSETSPRIKMRLASLNVGSMTGKGREIVEVMQRRRIDVMSVQEVRWKGERAREVGEGYKIFYVGEQSGRNGVGVIVSQSLVDSVVEVKRCSSRLMKIK